jgi:hypothetical protein
MKHLLIAITLLAIFALSGCRQEQTYTPVSPATPGVQTQDATAPAVSEPSREIIVYTTRTGECYHRNGCSSLSRSCIETTLSQAHRDGYRPCGRCAPPL